VKAKQGKKHTAHVNAPPGASTTCRDPYLALREGGEAPRGRTFGRQKARTVAAAHSPSDVNQA